MSLSSGYLKPCNREEATKDDPVTLLIIDPQVDFHTGSLPVMGANEDALNISAMIQSQKSKIDRILVTMDSHHKNHIAHASFWKSTAERPGSVKKTAKKLTDFWEPTPGTVISNKDVREGIWMPVDQSLKKYCEQYTEKLQVEGKNKFKLTIWPEHCLIGTVGHSVEPHIHAALQDWSALRHQRVHYIFKGNNNLTEMYSAIAAEVPLETDPCTMPNEELLNALRESKRLVVCGQALSHCVQYTVRDIVADWKRNNSPLSRIFLLRDGCSPVVIPGVVDYTQAGKDFLAEMTNEGVRISSCDEAFEDLPNSVY